MRFPLSVKNKLKPLVRFFACVFVSTMTINRYSRYVMDTIFENLKSRTLEVMHRNVRLKFLTINNLTYYRAASFADKEPETLKWIDGFSDSSVFWDIGANVGLYACYAAKSIGCEVYAFEPSVLNLELLAKNIHLNNLEKNVVIVPLALSDSLSLSSLNMSSLDAGGALSSFGQSYGQDGQKLGVLFSYRTLGLSVDEVVSKLNLPSPDYLKIDVDGIESLILSGAKNTLKHVKSILVEINEDFKEQSEGCTKQLIEAGFALSSVSSTDLMNPSGRSFNQVWERS